MLLSFKLEFTYFYLELISLKFAIIYYLELFIIKLIIYFLKQCSRKFLINMLVIM